MPSHRTERWVQYTVGVLVALSAIMLDVAQHQWILSAIVVPLTVLTHIFTDRLGIIRLPRLLVAVASLGAIFYFYGQFKLDSTTQQLNTIGNLLMAWSSMTLFQVKAERVFGSLAVFSMLAVVVAAVLNSGLLYGVLLIIYSITACFAMMALFLLREETYIAGRAAFGEEEFQRTRELSPAELFHEQSAITYQTTSANTLGDVVLRWAGLRHTAGLIFVTILFAFAYFYLIPRANRTRWKKGGVSIEQTVGFTDNISFQEMGRIWESDKLAMRVAFFDDQTNQAYRVFGDVYLYGKPLVHYSETDGVPSWSGYSGRVNRLSRLPFVRGTEDREVVRLEVSLEPTQTDIRFGVFPFTHSQLAGIRDPLRWSHAKQSLVTTRQTDNMPDDMQDVYYPDRYTLATTSLRQGAQSVFAPAFENWPKFRGNGDLDTTHYLELLDIDRDDFPGLIQKADQIVSKLEGETNLIRTSRALQDHFLTNEVYRYTLDFSDVKRTEGLDPIEDFVTNHRLGHCEYFASALTMMLRSQGIASRLVVGYRGGEYNPVGKYIQFYERDAHAWVEIFIPRDEVPPNVFTQQFVGTTGAWYRLDPTPGVAEVSKRRRTQLAQWVDYAQFVWNDYVVDLDRETQQTAVYDPFAVSQGGKFGRKLLESSNLSISSNARAAATTVWDSTSRFGPAGQLVAILFLAVIASTILASPFLVIQWFRRRSGSSKKRHARRQPIEFYARLEHILGKAGIKRDEWQTPLELARAGKLRLLELPDQAGAEAADIPVRIVNCFYVLRFGEQSLELATMQRIEGDLATLEDVVAMNSFRG
jgi:protein-glutamine gamma-glutamyltransferase